MKTQQIESFHVIGISVRTSNVDNKAAEDIGATWQKFMGEQIGTKIPNKQSGDIYAVYTHYDGDHMQPYTMILGHRVDTLENIPEGMSGISIKWGNYHPVVATGDLTNGVVVKAWQDIWQANLPRLFTSDFEVYGTKSMNPENAEVDIFIAVE